MFILSKIFKAAFFKVLQNKLRSSAYICALGCIKYFEINLFLNFGKKYIDSIVLISSLIILATLLTTLKFSRKFSIQWDCKSNGHLTLHFPLVSVVMAPYGV